MPRPAITNVSGEVLEVDEALIGITRHVATVGRSVRFEDLPEALVAKVKLCFLDWFGVTLAGSASDVATIARRVAVREAGAGQATAFGDDFVGTGPTIAAFANGVAAHALDFDDGCRAIHPSATIMPAAFAVAQDRDASGTGLIEGIVAGQEVESRAESIVGYAHFDAGWHSTGTVGTFGAVGAASRLLSLDQMQAQYALGIAGTMLSGLRASFGSMCKPLHAGHAAGNGTRAALLAEDGFTGAPDVFEAEHGIVSAMSNADQRRNLIRHFGEEWVNHPETRFEDPLRPLGAPYLAEAIYFKHHAACLATHAPIEAMKGLIRTTGLKPDDIVHIRAKCPPFSLDHCNILEPRTGLEGKFSIRYVVIAAMLGLDTSENGFTDDLVGRADVQSWLPKVTVERANPSTRNGPSYVEATTRDGRVLSYAASHPSQHVSSWDELSTKFLRLATARCGARAANELHGLIANLETLDSVRRFASAFHAG